MTWFLAVWKDDIGCVYEKRLKVWTKVGVWREALIQALEYQLDIEDPEETPGLRLIRLERLEADV